MPYKNENKIYLEDIYRPNDFELETIAKVYDKYYSWRKIHATAFEQFGNKTIRQYISEARSLFHGNISLNPLSDRYPYRNQEYRNQALKVLMYIMNLAQNPTFYGTEGLDVNLAVLLNAILKIYRRGTHWKILDLQHYLNCIIDGTTIVYVSWKPESKKIKAIKKYNPDTGEIEWDEKVEIEDIIEEIWVDPTDLLFPKVYEEDIQKQGEAIWRKHYTWSDFKKAYKDFPLSKFVHPGYRIAETSLFGEILDKTLLRSEKVEVINYYNSIEDEYILIANGVYLNSVKRKKVSPLVWNHKKLPFAKTSFVPTVPSLFYGNSLMHLIKDPVEARRRITELALDRLYKATNPPVITNDFSIPENFKLEGGRIYVSSGSWQELPMLSVDPNVYNMDIVLQSEIERTATPLQFPTTPSRAPRSATEMLQRQQAQLQSFQLQKTFYQDLLEQKVWLTIQNALQFLTVERLGRAVGEERLKRVLLAENIPTPQGLADLEIRITENLRTNEELATESILRSLSEQRRLHIIEVSPQQLRNIKFDVEIRFDLENTPALQKVLFKEFIQFLFGLFGNILDMRKVAVRTFEVWNENPADYLTDNILANLFLTTGEGETIGISEHQEQPIQSMGEQVQQTARGIQGVRGARERTSIEVAPNLTDLLTLE